MGAPILPDTSGLVQTSTEVALTGNVPVNIIVRHVRKTIVTVQKQEILQILSACL